jgi:hydrogenase small subunit
MSVLGATSPRLEELLAGALSQTQQIELVHPVLALEAGEAYLARLQAAAAGELDPFIFVLEGSLFDESRAGQGWFSRIGHSAGRALSASDWVALLAPRAAAVVAVGTCAAWGGVPAASGNVTGAHSLEEALGSGFRSTQDLPVIKLPGCAPLGDTVVEALAYLLLHMEGTVPLELDELGRPRWLYRSRVQVVPAHANWVERGQTAAEADCDVPSRGWINRIGGCAAVGGACNGCTMPNFPDAFVRLASPRLVR